MKLKNFRLVLLGSALLISFGSTFAADQPQNPDATTAQTAQKNKRLWNLKDVDIRTFIHAVSEETNKNFAIDPRVTGKVTLISAKPLNTDELYLAFLSVLQVNGFVALPDDNVIKIVPDYVAKGLSSPIYNENMKKQGDAMAVSVVSLKYVPANDLAGALNQFLTPSGHIAAYAPSNDLIVADRAGSIDNLMRMIAQIDQQQAGRIEMIRLHNANAKTVVETLKSMMTSKTPAVPGQGSIDLNLAADERTNSVLISGGSTEQRNQIHTLVMKLDQSTSRPSIATEVIYLKHLHAERAAVIVDSLIQNYLGKPATHTGTTQTQASSPNPGSTLFNTTISGGSNDVNTSQGSGANGVYAANVGTNDISSIVSVMPKSGSTSPYVQWEESTNSLVVTAPKDLMKKIKRVIYKLDIRRPQVLIEAVIAEVSEERQKELGIQWNPSGNVAFLTRFIPTLPLSMIGVNGRLTSAPPSIPGGPGLGMSAYYKGNEIRLLITALESDSESDVLATPNLVTLDNEPAQIKVGSKVPFSTAQIQNDPTGGNPFNFFNREDVGLVLTIDPQITPNGSIKLLIQQELSAIIPGTAGSGGNPITSERFIRTTVMADNGQILVLGGLLLNQWNKTTNGVPWLMRLPYFGAFFRDRNNKITKTNLMIFLRPTILYADSDNERVSGGKYEFLRQSQLKLEKNNPFRSGYEQPVLPVEGEELILPSPFPVMASKKHLAGEG